MYFPRMGVNPFNPLRRASLKTRSSFVVPLFSAPSQSVRSLATRTGMGGQGTMVRHPRGTARCARPPLPSGTKARQEARSRPANVRDKAGPARRDCMHDHMPPPVAPGPNPQRCEAMQKAHEACKGTSGSRASAVHERR